MENTIIIFKGTEFSKTDNTNIRLITNHLNEIGFVVNDEFNNHITTISLNRKTAVRFQRELKRQISFLENIE